MIPRLNRTDMLASRFHRGVFPLVLLVQADQHALLALLS
jgi:hypothetical protein